MTFKSPWAELGKTLLQAKANEIKIKKDEVLKKKMWSRKKSWFKKYSGPEKRFGPEKMLVWKKCCC